MNVLFCNIAWRKYYKGAAEEDKLKNGGSNVKENEYGHECSNFLDYNGHCYGFVQLSGNVNLETHFKEAKKNNEYLNDVLVIWVATNDASETRIVGWYENATVYREEQYLQAYTNEEFDLCYRMYAISSDCYLLPEEQRTFQVQRAEQPGKGTGLSRSNVWYADTSFDQADLVPAAIEYIENYEGEFENSFYTDEDLNEVIDGNYSTDDYKKLFNEGIKLYEDGKAYEALKYFNTARSIKETPEVLSGIAESLITIFCFDRAITILKKVIELEGNNLETVLSLIHCYDYIADRKKTIEYCKLLIAILDNSEEGINNKIECCCIMFNVYIALGDKKGAIEMMNKRGTFSKDEIAKECMKEMKQIIKEEFTY